MFNDAELGIQRILCVCLAAIGGFELFSTAAFGAPPESPAAYSAIANLVQNGSFEMDWMHNQVTSNSRFQLLEQSDWGYAQSDGLPDCWLLPPTARRDSRQARFGGSALWLQGDARLVVYLCGETDPQSGGAYYNPFTPLSDDLRSKVTPSPMRVGAWCKTENAGQPPRLSMMVEYAKATKNYEVDFSAASHDWEHRQIDIPTETELGVPHAAIVSLKHHGTGEAWFDGVYAEMDPSGEPNILLHGGFEAAGDGLLPQGWAGPKLWSWSRRDYYRFTGWSHEDGKMAGSAARVPLSNGSHALRMTLLPGDNIAVTHDPIALHQAEARPLEVSARIKADNLRWVEIMAQDESGAWVPQLDFSGFMGTDQHYRNRLLGAGTHDWEYVRKYFAPRKPLERLTLWLCARGLDGKLLDKNLVGTVWFDDIVLRECGSTADELAKRTVPVAAPTDRSGVSAPVELPRQSESTDPAKLRLGSLFVYPDEKLQVGVNVLVTEERLAEIAACEVALVHPDGRKVVLQTHDLSQQYWQPNQPRPPLLTDGHVDANRLLAFEIDGTSLSVHPANHPCRDCRLELVLKSKGGEVAFRQYSDWFGAMERPQPPSLPERIEKAEIRDDGLLLVNEKPFSFHCFPLEKADLGAISRLQNFPVGYKILPLPYPQELLLPAGDESKWKSQVQAFVAQHKGDPKLLGYFFNHNGETAMWFDRWRDMADGQRKIAGWVREIDANHLLFGAQWLFGHGGLTPEEAPAFNYLDVIDVEPGLTWTPDCHAVRSAAKRPISIIAGLECYYFQPLEVLRWRMYEAIRMGANSVGICPSNMLHPRPEVITFLRGLYGELAGLERCLAGRPPQQSSVCDQSSVRLWERESHQVRYLIASRGPAAEDTPITANLEVPGKVIAATVLFEGRAIPLVEGKFSDEFRPNDVHVYLIETP